MVGKNWNWMYFFPQKQQQLLFSCWKHFKNGFIWLAVKLISVYDYWKTQGMYARVISWSICHEFLNSKTQRTTRYLAVCGSVVFTSREIHIHTHSGVQLLRVPFDVHYIAMHLLAIYLNTSCRWSVGVYLYPHSKTIGLEGTCWSVESRIKIQPQIALYSMLSLLDVPMQEF